MQDDKIVWSSKGTEDWVWSLSDDELIREVSEFDDDMEDYMDSDGEYDFDRLRSRLLPDWDYDPDYEDLEEYIIPEIEKQCYNGMIWFIGNYQRWDGGRHALGFFDDVEKGLQKVCYPNYDSTAVLYDDDGDLCFTEYSHDAPMGGTAMTLYSFKNAAAFDRANEDGEDYDLVYDYAEDFDMVEKWIDEGLLTPIDAKSIY